MPSSSAHCVTGRTTSARRAVSDGNASHTTSKSNRFKRSSNSAALGADTTGFAPMTHKARTPPRSPNESKSSPVGSPGPGKSSAATPQMAATCSRSAALVSLR